MVEKKQKAIWVSQRIHKIVKLEATRRNKAIGDLVEEIISEYMESNCEQCLKDAEDFEGGA